MREINIKELDKSFVRLISDEWALLTAGTEGSWNTMTVSWGGLGELWGKNVVFVFVRPQRYTREFIDREELFSLSFFGDECKKALSFCGSKSGRDYDKAKETGLVPDFRNGTVCFEQAKTTIICKKLAKFDMQSSGFISDEIESCYNGGDYHYIYVGEILKTEISE